MNKFKLNKNTNTVYYKTINSIKKELNKFDKK